jgi:hypothetical protein
MEANRGESKMARTKRALTKRKPTPAAAAKRLKRSIRRLADDGLSVLSGTIQRARRRVKRAKRK